MLAEHREFIEVRHSYADAFADVGGRLYLSGEAPDVSTQLRHAGKLDLDTVVHLVLADGYHRCIDRARTHACRGLAAGDGAPLTERRKRMIGGPQHGPLTLVPR